MWSHLVHHLACIGCHGRLGVVDFEYGDRQAAPTGAEPRWIECGLLRCASCARAHPIVDGVPVMFDYRTDAWSVLKCRFPAEVESLPPAALGTGQPPPGEEFVQKSFSREWLEYDYDGTMWDLSYEDHEARFLAECGSHAIAAAQGGLVVEVGCGLGVSTFLAQKHSGGVAVGVDLGEAAARAAQHFKSNQNLLFVRASAFRLPIRTGAAQLIYSHGVLHHTYSTEQAVRSVARLVAPGGTFYVWVYGPGSLAGSPLRRLAWWLEARIRPVIGKQPDHPLSMLWLRAAACGYLLVNRYHHLRDKTVRRYSFRQALHAARDRFTPLFAFRHTHEELMGWLSYEGLSDLEAVGWEEMPSANQDNYRRNTGVRGRRPELDVAG